MLAAECAAAAFVGCVEHGQVVLDAHFGVDDYLAAFGVVYHYVGAEAPSGVGAYSGLYHVFLSASQAAAFENVFKNHLAPVALHFGVAFEGIGEASGLAADYGVEVGEFAHAAVEGEAFGGVAFGAFGESPAELLEVLAHGLQCLCQSVDILSAERVAVLCQCGVGQCAEPLFTFLHQFLLFTGHYCQALVQAGILGPGFGEQSLGLVQLGAELFLAAVAPVGLYGLAPEQDSENGACERQRYNGYCGNHNTKIAFFGEAPAV